MKYLLLTLMMCAALTLNAANWPREIESPQGTITIYEPQLDSYVGNSMKARVAISIIRSAGAEPIFGAVWLDCRVLTDRQSQQVALQDVKVRQIRFPNGTDQETAKISATLEQEIPRWELTFPLAELLESIDAAQKEKENARELDVTPPKILIMDRPAVLVLIDGEPILTDVAGTSLKRVVNTPYFLVQEPSLGIFYLKGGDIWYSSSSIMGPWRESGTPPPTVVRVSDEASSGDISVEDSAANDLVAKTGKIPEIVVSTEPAELIATDGPIQLSPIDGTGLLYATNTPSKLFLEIATQQHYVLFSGRWYAAKAVTGPWTYVASDKIPADFAKIPPGSPCDDVLASVPGTLPAKEAILDAQIPQTAQVDRATATSQVQYDGDPQFEPMEGTEMEYAMNASTPIIRLGGRYYDCDEGVWFEGPTPVGPWVVCIDVPDAIYTIPPRYPVYYVRYVRVYNYNSAFVYEGYTAGYTGCYVYNHAIVYGTGYHYRPWFRHYYYPRPWTWGFNVHYDPWTGWSMGSSRGWSRERGWFAHNGTNEEAGWWGPAGYRPLYRPHNGPEYREGYHPVYRPVNQVKPVDKPVTGRTRTSGGTRSTAIYDRWTTGVQRHSVNDRTRVVKESPKQQPPPVVKEVPKGRVRPIGQPTPPPPTPVVKEEPRVRENPIVQPAPPTPVVKEEPRARQNPIVQPAPPTPVVKEEPRARQNPIVQPAPPTPVVKEEPRAREKQIVQPAPPPPTSVTRDVPRPSSGQNNVYTTPEGGILRQTPQGWQQRDQNTWKDAGKAPVSSGADRDSQVRQRAAERTSSFTPPPPPAPRVEPRETPRPVQPAPKAEPQAKPREEGKKR